MKTDKAELFLYYWRALAPFNDLPEAEYHFDTEIGRKHRFDWAWPGKKIAVEVDGGQFAFRGGRHSTDADRDKLNIAASMGWRVFRFSPSQLKHYPETCIDMVRKALEYKNGNL